jgi:hypothetical protein
MKTSTVLWIAAIGVVGFYAYSQYVGASQPSPLQTVTNGVTKIAGLLFGKDSSSTTNPSTGSAGDGSVTIAQQSPAGALDTSTTAWTSNGDAAIADGTAQARLSGRQLQPSAYMTDSQRTQLATPFPVS